MSNIFTIQFFISLDQVYNKSRGTDFDNALDEIESVGINLIGTSPGLNNIVVFVDTTLVDRDMSRCMEIFKVYGFEANYGIDSNVNYQPRMNKAVS